MLKVGYIGLGLMGKSMARNIMKAGFPLVVFNRSKGSVEELVAEGAIAAESPSDLARQVDIVFTNLPDSPDVLGVVFGENGVADGIREGTIFLAVILELKTEHSVSWWEGMRVLSSEPPQCCRHLGKKSPT
jgi:2-hydroxy-3-oxopropionate reductase